MSHSVTLPNTFGSAKAILRMTQRDKHKYSGPKCYRMRIERIPLHGKTQPYNPLRVRSPKAREGRIPQYPAKWHSEALSTFADVFEKTTRERIPSLRQPYQDGGATISDVAPPSHMWRRTAIKEETLDQGRNYTSVLGIEEPSFR